MLVSGYNCEFGIVLLLILLQAINTDDATLVVDGLAKKYYLLIKVLKFYWVFPMVIIHLV